MISETERKTKNWEWKEITKEEKEEIALPSAMDSRCLQRRSTLSSSKTLSTDLINQSIDC